MLPTDSTIGIHVSANLNPVSFEYWYGVGFDNVTIMYKIVRVFGYKIVPFDGLPEYKYLVSHLHVLGTSSWKERESVPPCKPIRRYLHMETCID